MNLIPSFKVEKPKESVSQPSFNKWEKHGYKSLNGKLRASILNSKQRKEIDSFFKQELSGGKTRSNNQILEIVRKKFDSRTALKIRGSLMPAPIKNVANVKKKINIRPTKAMDRNATEDIGNTKYSNFVNRGKAKSLSSRSKVGFAGGSNPDQKVTEGIDNKNINERYGLLNSLK
jgi:hypothetical protein